jgi:predicted dehydrogenase
MLRVAIIGAGNVGRIRASLIEHTPDCRLQIVADIDKAHAEDLAKRFRAEATTDCTAASSSSNVDIVVICTPTKFHAQAAKNALQHGKHVLCEKPLARSAAEAREIVVAAAQTRKILKTGFNYRHMAHVRRAKELIDAGALGELYFVRCRYGHGGRPGYEKSWCSDRDLSGGGVLLEQGIHILDLVRHLLGEPEHVLAQAPRFFWNFPDVEDNCFVLLRTASSQIAQLHVSWTQWINIFCFEIFGRDGYLSLLGRDRHYGPQQLIWGQRQKNHGRPIEQRFDFAPPDDSWDREWSDFLSAVRTNREPMGSAVDGLQALHLVDAAYESARNQRWVDVPQLIRGNGATDDRHQDAF